MRDVCRYDACSPTLNNLTIGVGHLHTSMNSNNNILLCTGVMVQIGRGLYNHRWIMLQSLAAL